MTAKQLIEGSLRTINALASGEEATPSEMKDGLDALNGLISSWNNETLMIPSITQRTFTLDERKEFTYGVGGDFDAPRPIQVQFAQFIDEADFVYTCELYEMQTWAVNDRPAQVRPLGLYYEPSYPLAKIHFPTIPYATDRLRIQVIEPLTYISNPLDTFTLPDGYERALKLNLAVELCAEFGGNLKQETLGLAREAKQQIRVKNTKVELLTFDFQTTTTTTYNIVQGPVK